MEKDDIAAIRSLTTVLRELGPNEDFIRQGDRPKVSALVVSGMVARYHLLADGRRQYLSFHLSGDMPDSQALFIDHMDHAVCAMGPATMASIPHADLLAAFDRRPSLAMAIWRETLIDAAMFREAITNNSARSMPARMAHLFCELFYRARASGLADGQDCHLPIGLVQLGEALGMSLATVNRTLSELRESQSIEFRNGILSIRDWPGICEIAGFDPRYLHLKRPPL